MSCDRHYGDWRKGPNIEVLPLIVRIVDRELRMERLHHRFENVQHDEAVRLMAVHQVRIDERDEILKKYELESRSSDEAFPAIHSACLGLLYSGLAPHSTGADPGFRWASLCGTFGLYHPDGSWS